MSEGYTSFWAGQTLGRENKPEIYSFVRSRAA